MSTGYLLLIIFAAVVIMIVGITKLKLHPFLVLVLTTIALGLAAGFSPSDTVAMVEDGFGSILGTVGVIVITGGVIGTFLQETGAAQVIADTILKFVGVKRSAEAMAVAGYVTGIPLFCNPGYIALAPVAKAISGKSHVSMAVIASAMSAGLFTVHCFVPLHPGTLAIANTLGADFGLLMLVGLCVAIPGTIAGVIYAKTVSAKISGVSENEVDSLHEDSKGLPGRLHSFLPIVLILILVALKTIADLDTAPFGMGSIKYICDLIGNPDIALLIGMFAAMTLAIGRDGCKVSALIERGIGSAVGMLATIGAGGSFGAVLQALPLSDQFASLSSSSFGFALPLLGVLLPFLISAFFKTVMGATTVVQVLVAGITLPMLTSLGLDSSLGRVLCVLAIAAGSMVVSHANDAYFWIVANFSGLETKQAYIAQTLMTLVVGVVSAVVIYAIGVFCL